MKTFYAAVAISVVFSVLSLVNAQVITEAKHDKLQLSELGATRNVHSFAHAFGKDLLCGQPTKEEFAEAKQRGIRVVVTLRTQGEVDWNEPAAVEQLGLDFHRIGFRSPDTLTDEVFGKIRKVLNESKEKKEPVMLHCGSANRVGAVWAAHRVLDQGVSIDVAFKEAKTIGLRSEALRDKAIDYIQRQQAKQLGE